MADWANDINSYNSTAGLTSPAPASNGSGNNSAIGADEIAARTANVSGQLKKLYRKSVLPVEKRYKYDYFYESPLLTDVEFDCRL